MVDDSDAEYDALKELWPHARHALCCWHVFRNMHRRVADRFTEDLAKKVQGLLWHVAHARHSAAGRVSAARSIASIWRALGSSVPTAEMESVEEVLLRFLAQDYTKDSVEDLGERGHPAWDCH